jgi:uncharacterized membrane protein YeaQ/YmgE (transglycosylase-associated protein family)
MIKDRGIFLPDVVWTILTGLAVGIIAKLLKRGKNEPKGFILTALLGIAGAFVATFLGQFVGYLAPGEQVGFIGSIIGAVIVLYGYGAVFKQMV